MVKTLNELNSSHRVGEIIDELKTLKDFRAFDFRDKDSEKIVFEEHLEELRQEAIKWFKEYLKYKESEYISEETNFNPSLKDTIIMDCPIVFIIKFFNITEEELKE